MDKDEFRERMNDLPEADQQQLIILIHIADCIQELTEAVKGLGFQPKEPDEPEAPEEEERLYFRKGDE